jgi:hypothetical protein
MLDVGVMDKPPHCLHLPPAVDNKKGTREEGAPRAGAILTCEGEKGISAHQDSQAALGFHDARTRTVQNRPLFQKAAAHALLLAIGSEAFPEGWPRASLQGLFTPVGVLHLLVRALLCLTSAIHICCRQSKQ